MRKVVLFLVLVILMTIGTGCTNKPAAEKITVKDGEIDVTTKDGKDNANVKIADGKVSVESEDGKSELNIANDKEELSVPKDFPTNILPILPDAKIKTSSSIDGETGKSYSVGFMTTKSAKDVNAYYEDILKDVKDVLKMQLGEGYTLGGQKDGHGVSVVISKATESGFSTMVILTVGEKT